MVLKNKNSPTGVNSIFKNNKLRIVDNILYADNAIKNMKLFDTKGRVILSLPDMMGELNLGNLQKGVYFLNYYNNDLYTEKIILR